jgi:LysM repeat protein
MLKHKEIYLMGILLGLGAVAGGCAGGNKVASTEVPNQPMSNETAQTEKAGYHQTKQYVVKPNDCLWKIAGKPNVYADPFEWPLLFKANRDLIQDPDLIYAKQKLKVEGGLTTAEITRAIKLADSTPKYKPHAKRKESQLVEYF